MISDQENTSYFMSDQTGEQNSRMAKTSRNRDSDWSETSSKNPDEEDVHLEEPLQKESFSNL